MFSHCQPLRASVLALGLGLLGVSLSAAGPPNPPHLPITRIPWGAPGDVPVVGDFDGDGIADLGVFRPSTGIWYLRLAVSHTMLAIAWGAVGDVPMAADYDGDGITDLAVYRPSTGVWYIWHSRPVAID